MGMSTLAWGKTFNETTKLIVNQLEGPGLALTGNFEV